MSGVSKRRRTWRWWPSGRAKRGRTWKPRTIAAEPLEDRRLLALASPPDEPLPIGSTPMALAIEPVDGDEWPDLVALDADGRLTVALHGGSGGWNRLAVSDLELELNSVHGLALGLLDDDLLLDAVIQHDTGLTVARGNGAGRFTPLQTWRSGGPASASALGSGFSALDGSVHLAVTLLDGDFEPDVVAVLPGTSEVLVFFGGNGDGSGPLHAPVRYASGGQQPVAVVVGPFLGSPLPDLAVGHRDGTVTFFEGLAGGRFLARPEATVGGLGTIRGLAAGDGDEDGDLDLAASGSDRVTVLWQDDDLLPARPLVNGDFAAGLTGWTAGDIGDRQAAVADPAFAADPSINALSGIGQLWESQQDSLLTSLHQAFTIPPSPQTLSFELVALGLEPPLGGVPDAFEVSLLNEAGQSLVPVFRPEATSFFNANPDGAVAWAEGVTWDGRQVTLDIASLAPGTPATLVFDLIGNPPGRSSVVAIDNVRIAPDRLPRDSFTPLLVASGLAAGADLDAGDVDGDGHADLVVTDAGADRLVILHGDGAGRFARDAWSVAAYGHGPHTLALGQLTPNDNVLDAAIGLADGGRVLTPLGMDELPPRVTLVQPVPNQTATAAVTQLALQFSEAMRDAGPAGERSVTDPAAYRLYSPGPNGRSEDGGGDDVRIPLGAIRYDAAAHRAFLSPVAGPLPDGPYALLVGGGNPRPTPVDLAGNPLAAGDAVQFSFTVNAVGPVDLQAAGLTGSEGQAITLKATFRNPGSAGPHTAIVDWGDGSSEPATVQFTAEWNPAMGLWPPGCSFLTCLYDSYRNPGYAAGSLAASHVYADNGRYTVRVSVADQTPTLPPSVLEVVAQIANLPPELTVPAAPVRHTGLYVAIPVGTFTDPGFDAPAAGTVETFRATIDWGDGSQPSAGLVTASAGAAGRPTTGAIQGQHRYTAVGTYPITVTVADDDGGVDTGTFTVQVQAAASTRFFVVDRRSRAAYLYDAGFAPTGAWPLVRRNAGPRGVAANPAGDRLWVVNHSQHVFAYDAAGTLRGSWRADDVHVPQDIATDGRNLWILDAALDRVFFFADGTQRESGQAHATSSFALHPDNRLPRGLATDGTRLWVTDGRPGQARVFVYALDGQPLGSWSLDPAHGPPGGITLQRSTGDLWILDERDRQVHRYVAAALRTSGSQLADAVFPLTAANRYPSGIADPVTPIQIGDTVSDSSAAGAEADEFAFEVPAAGSAVFVDFQSLTGGVLETALVRSVAGGAQTVYTAASLQTAGLDRGPLELPAGTYTLQVRASGSGTRQYAFRLWAVPAPAVLDTSLGAVNQGLLPSPGASAAWRFTAAAGQSIYVDFQDAAGNALLETQLLDPAGAVVYAAGDWADDRLDRGPLTLTSAGTYTLAVRGRGDQTGAYQFQVWDVPPDRVQAIPLNRPIHGQTTSPVDRVRYRFEAQAGEQLLVDLIDNLQQVYFDLERPSGGLLFRRQTGDQLTAALPESGTYTLVASSYQPVSNAISDHFGEFQFQVQQVAAPQLGVPDSRGTDFWLAFPRHYRDVLGAKDAELVLQVTADSDTSGTVTLPGQGDWMAAFTVRAGQVTRITLPDSAEIAGSDQVESRGVRVRALQEVTVHALSSLPFGSDGYLALPRDAFGHGYLVLSYGEGDAAAGRTSSFSLVATEDGTTATITLPVNVGPHAANEPYSIQLNAGQVYELAADAAVDLTGTRIEADRPIGVYGSHRAAQVPAGYNAANHLVEQLPPVDTWGRQFLTVPLATRTGGDRFRILAARDGTEVRVDGAPVATLARGQCYETVLARPAQITASEPVLVAQFAHGTTYDSVLGDPTMLLVPPVEQYVDHTTLTTPLTGFDVNYINVVAPESSVGTLTLDGAAIPAAQFTPIAASGYVAAQLPVAPGPHRLAASAAADLSLLSPHSSLYSAFAYGFAERDAYGYPAGQAFGRINAVANLELAPSAAEQLVGNQQAFVATLLDGTGEPLPGVRVEFAVAGTHTDTGFAFTDRLGRAVFTLVGSRPGADTVTATVGTWSDTAAITWTAPPPTVSVTSPESDSELRAGSFVVLSGRATPGVPAAPVLAVTVNGRPVDSLDVAGNWFALWQVPAGVTELTVQATDAFGQAASAELTLVGVEPPAGEFAFEQARDTTAAGQLAFEGTFFNRQTQTLQAAMRLTNTGRDPLRAAVLAVFDRLSPLDATLATPDGLTPSTGEQVPPDRPYVTFDAAAFDDDAPWDAGPPSEVLAPGETSRPVPVRLTDPQAARLEFSVTLLAIGNTPPEFSTPPATEAAADRPYRYAAAASDPDGDTLTYQLTAAPEFLSIDPASGLITGTPTAGDVGTHRLELTAADGFGGIARQAFQLQVWTAIPNRPPIVQSLPQVQAAPGEAYAYAYQAQAEDPDGDALRYTLATAPSGMTINETTGLVAWPQAVFGTHTISLCVDDNHGGQAQQIFILTVGPGTPNAAPQFDSAPPVRARVGELYLYAAAAADPEGDELRYSLSQAPPGMTVDAGTGVVQWQPAVAQTGLHPVTLRVADPRGGAAVQRWLIDVTSTSLNRPPLFVGHASSLPLTQNSLATLSLLAQDPEGDPLRYELVSAPAGMSLSPASPGQGILLTWTPTAADLGWHRVVVRAYDPLDAYAQQVLYVEVRRPNTPPRFTSQPLATGTAGAVHRDLPAATDDEDAFTYSLVAGPPGLTVDAASGLLFWRTTTADAGTHPITVRATDDRGLETDLSFTLALQADAQPPDVSVRLSDQLIDLATTSTVVVQVLAVDNVAVTTVTLSLNGTPLPPDAWQRYEFTPPAPGLYQFTATAADAAGNIGTGTATLRVFDPADSEPPVVELTSPAGGDVLTYLTDVVGTVTDQNLEFFRLQSALAGAGQWTTFYDSATEHGPFAPGDGVVADVLGVFDPTLLQRDNYDLRVVAQDINGRTTIVQLGEPVSVEGRAVLGNFRLDVTDLTIPLAGIPIRIQRTYDTLNAQRSGDFGFGWQLSVAQANVRESVRTSDAERSGIAAMFAAHPFRDGTRVYLTNPAGRRVGFTFQPQPAGGVLGTLWHPRFVPDPGVYDQLTVEDTPLSQHDDGTYTHYLVNLPYNPSQYQLTTKDGLTYRYDQFAGLQDITDRNQNVLTYSADAITSSTGVAIRFERDAQGRITQITDPAGNTIRYAYDAAGDLVAVEDQIGNRSTYGYLASPAHYLTRNSCPSGVCIAGTEYDAAGRLTSLTDSLGQSATRQFDVLNNREIVSDLLGNETTLVFDARGNVLATTDPRGNTTQAEYDADDNVVVQVDARGYTTRASYDERGNQTSLTDALENTWRRTYDARDNLLAELDPQGNRTQFAYDASGNLLSVTDARGYTLQYERDPAGRVVEAIDSNQHATSFSYDRPADSQPTAVTFADGSTLLTEYDAWGQPTRTVNGRGDEFVFRYDAAGKLVETRDPLGGTVRMEYDGERLVRLVDPLGHETRYEYDAAGRLARLTNALGDSTRYAYDANGRVTEQTDAAGRVTRYAYRADGRLASETDPLGTVTSYEYDAVGNVTAIVQAAGAPSPLVAAASGSGVGSLASEDAASAARTTRFRYDELNRIIEQVGPLGATQLYAWDALGQLTGWTDENGFTTAFAYDQAGRLLKTIDALDGVETRTYDGQGNLLSITDRNGGVTRFAYDGRDRLIQRRDALGGVFRWEYDEVGNVLAEIDENGHVWRFAYDALNRLVQQTDALGGSDRYSYDAAGNLLVWTDARGNDTSYAYDELQRLLSITDPLGGMQQFAYDAAGNAVTVSDANNHVTQFVYDAVNRLVQSVDAAGGVESFAYDPFGNLKTWTDALENTTSYTYDVLDRLIATTDELGGVSSWAYDAAGNLTAVTDANGHATGYAYDGLNRLVSVTDPNHAVSAYTYDAVGNRLSVSDPTGQTTRYAYDALNRVRSETDPLGRSCQYAYDPVGNLTQATDRNGRIRTFGYDALDRRIMEDWWDDEERVRRLQFAYDAVGNLTGASDPDSEYALAYDALDRLTQIDNRGTARAPHVVLDYAYDAVGNVVSVRDSAGVRVTATYDARDGLSSQVWQGGQLAPVRVEFAYTERGELTEVRRFADPEGTRSVSRSTFSYDPRGRLTHLTHQDAVDAVLAEYDYTFDLADQLVREVDHGLVFEYTYDSAGQLTAVEHEGQGDETYAYDANGNRIGGQYTVGPNNQVLADAAYNYEYDAEGNLIGKTERASGMVSRYAYDHRNRLVRFEQSSAGGILLAAADYVYDVFDRRIVKSVDRDGSGPLPPQETHFVYDGLNAWADFDGGNRVLARYLHGTGLDNLLARWRPDGGTAWYLGDHLGSVRDTVDAAGAIVNRLAYDSFGQLVSQTNPAAGDRFGFTGRESDPELGLYYYRARYYDPQLGRFVSQDPLGFAGGDSNLYRYVGNAPLTARDPLGLSAVGLFYGLMARRSSMAAGAVVGGVLGFACGWVEGFAEASSAGSGNSESAAIAAFQRASSYAAVGVALGGTLAGLPSAVQFYGGGILLGAAAGMIIRQAPQDPWQVTAVRVGCVVLSAAVAPAAHRWLTPRVERLPYMGPTSPHAPASPTPPVPRGQAGGAVEPAPAPAQGPLRQRLPQSIKETGRTTGATERHSAWGRDLNAINSTSSRLAFRAMRRAGGDPLKAEMAFESYMQGVANRLARIGSKYDVEIQPAANASGRVWNFVQFRQGRGWTKHLYAYPGSRRLDAGIVDTSAAPNAFGLRPLVSGFDITLNASKPNIVQYYQEYFGKIPVFDLRLP